MAGRVLNFGSLNLDYVYQVDHFVRPGETISAKSQSVNAGGKGLNQSCALARAGATVFHAGCVGNGGEPLLEILRADGADTSFILQANVFQGNAVIQVDPTGENCILLYGGSNQCITEEQIEETLTGFGRDDVLLLQNEINNLPLIVDKAYERGMTIILNPSPYDDRLLDVDFGKLSWLLVNEVEMEQVSGTDQPDDAWKQLYKKYPELSLLITLGKQGSIAFRTENGGLETAEQQAFPVKALDTTAAGDTFTGYFVAALMEQRPLAECMKLATAASAISVTRPGAAPSIPGREEVERFLKESEKAVEEG